MGDISRSQYKARSFDCTVVPSNLKLSNGKSEEGRVVSSGGPSARFPCVMKGRLVEYGGYDRIDYVRTMHWLEQWFYFCAVPRRELKREC
jgi:hypothetical protein